MSSHSTRSGAAPSLSDEILGWLSMLAAGDVQVLAGYLNGKLNRLIASEEVENALLALSEQELIERVGSQIWLSEPDRREFDLYAPLDEQLRSSLIIDGIGASGREIVFQKTATGGPSGDGPLTRPDFTLAAIRSWRFDPQRTLEVYSFEVKNRAGTSISAVYEAVAHGRFAHHPYLVCPRSRFNETLNKAILDACVREGIGLIAFDIVVPKSRRFEIEAIEVVTRAERRAPDPQLVEGYLASRLCTENCMRLETFAKGNRP